jgi:RNA polymerase sigma factor (sigma-70 family)
MTDPTKLLEHLGRALLLREGVEWTDAQLLDWFIEHRDEAAFTALVRRHGPMVWGVCRRLLDHHDAEDAFQATFMVLVRKAAAIRPREMVGNWLYGVAHQTALHARRTAARRRLRERQVIEMPDLQAAEPNGPWQDLQPLLDQELSRLPAKYRAVMVLCVLEGKSRKEVARQLGVPEGTVAGRLARARTMLEKHLARQGLALSADALAALVAQSAVSACLPAGVVSGTIKTASVLAAGRAASAGVMSATVAELTDGVLKTMFLTKLKVVTAGLCALALVAGGVTLGFTRGAGRRTEESAQAAAAPKPGADHVKNNKPPDKARTAEEEFKALVKAFDAGEQNVFLRDKYEKLVLQLALDHPKEPFVVDALLWILKRGWQPNGGILLATSMPFGQSAGKALQLLARDHVGDKRAGAIAGFLGLAPAEADLFLRALMEKNPDRNVQGHACLALAVRARRRAEEARSDARKDKETEKYLKLAVQKYGDVSYFDTWTVGKVAGGELFEVRHLRPGRTAPEIEGEDLDGKRLRLSDHRGKVVLVNFCWWGHVPRSTIRPFERSLTKTFEGRPFILLGIHRDGDRKALQRIREEEKILWRSWVDVSAAATGRWLDGGNMPGPIAVRWNIRSWPTLYLLDHKGVIREKGKVVKDLEKRVEELVREAEAAAK